MAEALENYEKLGEIVNKLKYLLDEPQLGHFTWHNFLEERLKEILAFIPRQQYVDYCMKDSNCMNEITKIMSGKEWSPDTLDYIAEVIKESGRKIEETS